MKNPLERQIHLRLTSDQKLLLDEVAEEHNVTFETDKLELIGSPITHFKNYSSNILRKFTFEHCWKY